MILETVPGGGSGLGGSILTVVEIGALASVPSFNDQVMVRAESAPSLVGLALVDWKVTLSRTV